MLWNSLSTNKQAKVSSEKNILWTNTKTLRFLIVQLSLALNYKWAAKDILQGQILDSCRAEQFSWWDSVLVKYVQRARWTGDLFTPVRQDQSELTSQDFSIFFNIGIKGEEIVWIYVTRLWTSDGCEPCDTSSADASHGGNFILSAQSQGGHADDISLLADSLKMKGGLPRM